MKAITPCLLIALLGTAIHGCGGSETAAVSSGHNTALDSMDLQTMTQQMATSMTGDKEVQAALRENGKLVIVTHPVENRMTGEVLPAGQADAFTARVRALLSQQAPERYTWVMNRDAFYRLRARELDVDLGPDPDRLQPQYQLSARFTSVTDESSKGRTSAYLCIYELTDIQKGTLLWTDKYEVQKRAVKKFLD